MSCLCRFAVVLSALGLAGVLGYLIWVASSESKAIDNQPRIAEPTHVGFVNNGGTCYQNAVLQNIVRLPQMEAWARTERAPSFDVTASLYQLYFDVFDRKMTPVNPTYVRDAMSGEMLTPWNNGQTQDSSEFFAALMASIEVSPVLATARFTQREAQTCDTCGFRANEEAPQVVLQIYFPENDQALDLQAYIRELVTRTPENCRRCQTANGQSVTVIDPMPDILVVNFMRSSADGSRRLTNEIVFPLAGADFNGRLYNLSGVVDHHGGAQGGHYVSTVKNHADGSWVHYDDEVTSQVPSSAVLTNDTILAFFIAA